MATLRETKPGLEIFDNFIKQVESCDFKDKVGHKLTDNEAYQKFMDLFLPKERLPHTFQAYCDDFEVKLRQDECGFCGLDLRDEIHIR